MIIIDLLITYKT